MKNNHESLKKETVHYTIRNNLLIVEVGLDIKIFCYIFLTD